MIVSHRAPSSLNMSSYRAIWTHFRSNSIIVEQIQIPKIMYLNFQISRKLVIIHREGIFSKKCAPPKMMQNGQSEIFWGRTCKNTNIFTFEHFEHILLIRSNNTSQSRTCVISGIQEKPPGSLGLVFLGRSGRDQFGPRFFLVG